MKDDNLLFLSLENLKKFDCRSPNKLAIFFQAIISSYKHPCIARSSLNGKIYKALQEKGFKLQTSKFYKNINNLTKVGLLQLEISKDDIGVYRPPYLNIKDHLPFLKLKLDKIDQYLVHPNLTTGRLKCLLALMNNRNVHRDDHFDRLSALGIWHLIYLIENKTYMSIDTHKKWINELDKFGLINIYSWELLNSPLGKAFKGVIYNIPDYISGIQEPASVKTSSKPSHGLV